MILRNFSPKGSVSKKTFERYASFGRQIIAIVIVIVVGALGSIPLRLKDNLRAIEVGIPVGLIQRCALLGSARILRTVLEM